LPSCLNHFLMSDQSTEQSSSATVEPIAEPATPVADTQPEPSPSPIEPSSVTPQVVSQTPSSETAAKKPLTSVKRIGVSCDKNARYRRTMEDAHVVFDQFDDVESQGYFAVYDGHGGRAAVEFVANNLHKNLLEALKKTDDVEEAFKQSYLITDQQIAENKIQFSGTTTASALIRVENGVRKLYTANVGDARCVLCRNGVAERLTYDHKATDDAEIQRVVGVGGFVVSGRVNGIIAVTRSLGDQTMKEYVSGEPYTRIVELQPTDTHLIVACDGIWDILSDQQACDIVLQSEAIDKASRALMISSLKGGSTDNISVMVIEL